MLGWNHKETVLQFIDIYRTLPALWKVKSKEYSNKLTKELSYATLIEFCSKFEPSADKQFVVSKINNLRSAFKKELKKVETSKLSGAGTDEIYESKLWYFPYLMFIQDQEVPRTGMSNLDIENARQPSSSLYSSQFLTVKSEVSMSPSASSENSVGLDASENNRNEDFTPLETLSRSSLFFVASSQSTSCSRVSSQGPSPGLSHSQGPSSCPSHSEGQLQGPSHSEGQLQGPSHSQGPSRGPSYSQGPSQGPWHSQGPFPVALSPGPSHTSFHGTPQEFSGRPASKTPAAKRPNKRKSRDEEILNAARARLLNPTPPPTLDENESFGQTIGLLLRNASKEQRIYARKLMYEVMVEAELGNLSRASYFVAAPDFSDARRAENVQDYQSKNQIQ